jgi:phage repressor protein C with HTH and peptisase S24 domain
MRNDWLARRLKELGKTGQGLANSLGINKSRVSEIIGGRRGVKADEILTISNYLEMTERDVISLLSGVSMPPMQGLAESPSGGTIASPSRATPRYAASYGVDAKDLPPPSTMPVDVPVYGTTLGGAGCDFELNNEVIDRVRRPSGLTNARNAFAVYVVGNSMSPRYDEGDLVFVHPGRPPVPGSDVVVELQSGDEPGRTKVLFSSYRGKSATSLLLSQLNPARDVEIPLDTVKQVLRVLRVNELLGV